MDSDGSSTVALTVASPLWRGAFDALDPLVERIVQAVVEMAAVEPWVKAGEVSLLLTDDQEIRSLNASYRARNRVTNVLSFPSLDLVEGGAITQPASGPILLGDVAISFERLSAEASDQEKALTDHLAHLLVHGTLHLLGYDHDDDGRAAVMEGLEASILLSLGFAAPYASSAEEGGMSAGPMSVTT
ncbi:MAG: rRNA maturation RNase YbeY [Geminicoccaceae bacterium]